MAEIDKKYHDLLLDILHNGYQYEDPNRKGTIRTEIQSHTLVHSFKDGFPAITTKKLAWKSVVGELLWFLRGSNDIRELWDNNINIWDKDWYNWYKKQCSEPYSLKEMKEVQRYDPTQNPICWSLGRIYGAQWRKWKVTKKWLKKNEYDDELLITFDQIFNLIKGLKENPMGTKHIVTAWNPAELDNMALPPCHWSFEILVKPIDKIYLKKRTGGLMEGTQYSFTLKWHQRSVDTFLGLPFNIASYALLAHIIGKMTNMVPEGIIGDLSNVHIYDNHIDAVKEQLKRDPNKYDNCELDNMGYTQAFWDSHKNDIDGLIRRLKPINRFKLKNYNSYPRIKAEMIPYTN